jgi:hypothetical protein
MVEFATGVLFRRIGKAQSSFNDCVLRCKNRKVLDWIASYLGSSQAHDSYKYDPFQARSCKNWEILNDGVEPDS